MRERAWKGYMTGWIVALCAGFFACGGGGGAGGSTSSSGSNSLFLAVKATAPTFTASAAAPPARMARGVLSVPGIPDPAMNVAFQLLRDYSYPEDEGRVDMTNIYKVLFETGGYLEDAASICSPIDNTTDEEVSSYGFSDFLGHTYDCGGTESESGGYGKSIAYRESGADRYMLASYKWAPDASEQIAIGAIQTQFNDTTKDVDLTFAQAVRYPPGSVMGGEFGDGFATRTRITGNSESHAFELKIALVNSGGTRVSLVGKGVSQGEGNHFLLRYGAQYYCLPAGATEEDLVGAVPTDHDTVSPSCTGYLSGVDAMGAYDVDYEVPQIDLSDFDLGVAGTPVNYLMF